MADETIKLQVELDPTQAQRGAQQVGQALDGVGQRAEGAGRQLARAFSQVEWAALRENATAAFNTIRGGAEALSRSAGESERLSRASRNLGLDFSEAARSAGGVVDEIELLNASNLLAARGIQVSQAQLAAFARTAQDYARGSGKEFREVSETLADALAEGGEELGKFGPTLAGLQAPTSNATERLDALVQTTRESAPAARTAAESYRDLTQAVTDAQRGFAEGFAEGIAEIRRVHGETSSARDVMRELKDDVFALGGATATVFAAIADGARVVVTEVGNMVSGLTDAVDTFGQLRANPLRAGEILRGFGERENAREAASQAAFDRLMQTLQGSDRTSLAVDGPAGAGPTRPRRFGGGNETELGITGTGSDAAFAEANRRAEAARAANDNAQSLSLLTVGSAELNAIFDRELGRAESRSAEDFGRLGTAALQSDFVEGIRGITGVSRGDAAARFGDPLSEIDARNAALNRRQPGGAPGDRLDAQMRAREQRQLDERLDAMRTFTDRWEELHGRQASAAQMAAESGTAAFNIFGQALGKHLNAIVAGQETVAFGLQSMLSDTLTAIGTEAIVKGAMQIAEGLAAVAGIVTAPKAPLNFAAGAAYIGVGTLAASLGGAIAPSAPSVPSGASAPALPASAPIGAMTGTANDNARGGPTEITINLGGGVVLGSARELGEALGRVINDPNGGVQINASRVAGMRR